jgi:hypothetical protein
MTMCAVHASIHKSIWHHAGDAHHYIRARSAGAPDRSGRRALAAFPPAESLPAAVMTLHTRLSDDAEHETAPRCQCAVVALVCSCCSTGRASVHHTGIQL